MLLTGEAMERTTGLYRSTAPLWAHLERFFGILIEHYAGAFPLWLATPVQIGILTIAERHSDYALKPLTP